MKIRSHLSILSVFALFLSSTCLGYGHFQEDYKGEHEVILAPCRLVLKDGIYLGGGLGYDSYRLRQAIDVIGSNGTPIVATPAITANGLLGNVFFGYGQYFNWFYFGGEVFVKYSRTGSGFGLNVYDSDVSIRTSLGVSLLPGIKVTDTSLIYARVGYDRTRFKVNESGTLLGSDSRREWANGIDLGLGIETAIYRNFSLRGEYTYTSDSEFDTPFETSYSPSNNEFSIGLVYHFAC